MLAVMACGRGSGAPDGRLTLRAAAARELGLAERALLEVDSAIVPSSARKQANALRTELEGASAPVRYYSRPGGASFVALIPSRSFEGTDPHVVAAFAWNQEPKPKLLLRSYEAVEVYCPAAGRTDSPPWWRD